MNTQVAQPFREHPQRRDQYQLPRLDRTGEARLQIAHQGRIQRENDAEEQRGHGGQHRRHVAVVVQTDVDRADAGEKQAQPVGEAQSGGAARRGCVLPQPEQAGRAKNRQRIQAERRKAQHRSRAEEGGRQRGARLPRYSAVH